MNLKNKIATSLSLLFSVLLGMILCSIYLLFAAFRRDEFRNILKDRIATTYIFFISRNQDYKDFSVIDDYHTYVLRQEQVLVFDKSLKLIYSNIKDREVDWDRYHLSDLKENGKIYRKEGETEIYGEKIHENYYVVQATDTMGGAKLEYLRNLIVVSFLMSSALVWLISFLFAKKMMMPLDDFQKRITNISINNLNEKLPETNKKDEINLLAKVFNTMMERINLSYSAQKEFAASASHEIKTPLTRMSFQLENLMNITHENEKKAYISGIQKEIFQLSDTVNSLLVLSNIEENRQDYFEEIRMDEVVFDAYEIVKKNFPEFEMDFKIVGQGEEGDLIVKGVKSLLEITLINLFKNAVLYSFEPKASVELSENKRHIEISVVSKGERVSFKDREKKFEAFRRGDRSSNRMGSGLGLKITKRILDFHGGEIGYHFVSPNINVFVLKLPSI